MLKSLTIYNYALVENAVIEFDAGLNIITGETGTGKSIMIDALSCVLGERTSTDSIRSGQEFLRVEAIFDLTANQSVLSSLDEMAIPVEDDSNIIITRRLSAAGKNTVLINGCQTTVNTLKKFTEKLIDIHGQHESQSLLRTEAYIGQLDGTSADIIALLESYRKLFGNWKGLIAKREDAEQRGQERERRLDMLSWQSEEIAAARLKPDEDVALGQQIKLIANSEKIASSVNNAVSLLTGETNEKGGIVANLSDAKKAVEQAARFDSKLERQAGVLTEMLYQLQDVEIELRNYFQEMDFDPACLAQLQTRMDTIYKLRKKYGNTIAEILDYYNQAVLEIADLKNLDIQVDKIKKQCAELEMALAEAGEKLDRLRRHAGAEMESHIEGHLIDLGMTGAKFVVDIQKGGHFNERGLNQILFLFTANPGEEPRPLNRIASGGELSRIALAMKAVSSIKQESQTMVFDELDAGIGGKTAQMVAEKIAFVSLGKQVLCITHLPQIAVMGDRHFCVEKIIDKEKTKSVVRKLEKDDRVNEIARMLSGDDQSKSSLENALAMLKDAKIKKEKWKNKA